MMGHDLRNWYFNPAETTLSVANASQLKEKWRFTVSGFPLGTPTVADGKVFVFASGGLYALDLEKGTELWHRSDIVGSSSPAYENGFLYLQESAIPPHVYKLKADDGSTVWGPVKNCLNDSACSGEASAIVVNGLVLIGRENNMNEALNSADVGESRGAVFALDAETGQERWTYHTIPDNDPSGESGASVWSTVSVDLATNTIFATTGNAYRAAGGNANAFHAIDFATGTRKWVSQVRKDDVYTAGGDDQLDMDFGANPILAEVAGRKLVAAGDKGGAFWALDRETGAVVWSRENLAPSHDAVHGGVFINGAFDGRAFYVVSNDPKSSGSVMHRLDGVDGKSTWTHAFSEVTWAAPSLANGLVAVPINTTLYVMNAETGEILTQFDTGGTIAAGAPAIVQGKIIVKSGLIYTDLTTRGNDQVICYALP